MSTQQNPDLKKYAYDAIKERLITCVYEPGTLLKEIQIAADLNLSRTPVREAINRLDCEGYVNIMPKKGIFVPDIRLSDVMQIFQARIELEPVILQMAAPRLPTEALLGFRDFFSADPPDPENTFRLDMAIHLFFTEHCGNRYLASLVRRLLDDNTRMVLASKLNLLTAPNISQEHKAILNALIEKKYEQAQSLMRAHIETSRHAALKNLASLETFGAAPPKSYQELLSTLK